MTRSPAWGGQELPDTEFRPNRQGETLVSKNQTILVVDAADDTREVLETVLGRRGVRTYHARRVRDGAAMADRIRPDLIVLDLELPEADADTLRTRGDAQRTDVGAPVVMLGSMRRNGNGGSSHEFIRKPYDYGPLVRRIEELLVAADPTGASGDPSFSG
jgi:DNA-binding response OmpR family regulator